MKILFSGGGTAGPVTPLIAVAQEIQLVKPDSHLLWIGTFRGPEKTLVMNNQIQFMPIFSGKLRRYFSWRNFVDPFLIVLGFFQSLYILKRFDPDVVVSAGAFVSVPVAWAAWVLRKPVIIHQLDIKKGLANTLMTPCASKVTVSFPELVSEFPEKKVEHIGTPIRSLLFQGDRNRAYTALNLDSELPTILVLGGGTGSLFINKLTISSLPELLNFCQVIHITGSGKGVPAIALKEKEERYHSFEFVVDELPNIFAAADVVICRAGIGTLTELAALGKPAVVIPIPDSQQEKNVEYFKQHQAVIELQQKDLSAQSFIEEIRELLNNPEALVFLHKQIQKLSFQNSRERMRDIILEYENRIEQNRPE